MLRRLLKYDFKSVFKFWWIAALSSLALSLGAGCCINILTAERSLALIVNTSAALVLILAIIGIIAFPLLTSILICVRFYKNLFTDEGYLTFTLPVKISSILNSKILLSMVAMTATAVVLLADLFAMLAVGFPDYIFDIENIKYYLEIIGEIIAEIGWYFPVYAIEFIALILLLALFSQMFLYCCITFASLITKKARVITAIGIYYAANGIFSFIIEMLMIFSLPTVFERIGNIQNSDLLNVTFIIVLMCAIVLCVMGCIMLYTLQYWMLDRKLNLA